jgi:hypothetical protein
MSLFPSSIVQPTYHHVDKSAYPLEEPGDRIERLKWYAVREPSREIPASVLRDARTEVARLVSAEDIGFVILHLCGADFFFLLICRWRENNELWETVLAKDGAAPFELVRGGDTRATFCVWELAVVGAERAAWAMFLRSEREEPDLHRYEAQRFSGNA